MFIQPLRCLADEKDVDDVVHFRVIRMAAMFDRAEIVVRLDDAFRQQESRRELATAWGTMMTANGFPCSRTSSGSRWRRVLSLADASRPTRSR